MDLCLLDTNIVSDLYGQMRPGHMAARQAIVARPTSSQWLSVVVLAELQFGLRLAEARHRRLPHIEATIALAEKHPLAEIRRHTAEAYGDVKARLSEHWLPNLDADLPRWPEDWKDRVSGKLLQVDENDLWIVAQAIERNYVLLTADKKLVERFAPAVKELRVQLVT